MGAQVREGTYSVHGQRAERYQKIETKDSKRALHKRVLQHMHDTACSSHTRTETKKKRKEKKREKKRLDG